MVSVTARAARIRAAQRAAVGRPEDQPEFVPARRGDLVLMVRTARDLSVPGFALLQERTSVEVCVVTGITRAGVVRMIRGACGRIWPVRPDEQAHVCPAAEIDVEAAYAAGQAHTDSFGYPCPFGSLAEATEAVKPFRR